MFAMGLCLTHIRQSFQFLWGSDNPRIVFRSVTLKGVIYGFELIIVVAVCEIQSGYWITLIYIVYANLKMGVGEILWRK